MEYRTTGTRSRLLYLPLHHILSSSGEGCEQQIYQCSDAILFFFSFLRQWEKIWDEQPYCGLFLQKVWNDPFETWI